SAPDYFAFFGATSSMNENPALGSVRSLRLLSNSTLMGGSSHDGNAGGGSDAYPDMCISTRTFWTPPCMVEALGQRSSCEKASARSTSVTSVGCAVGSTLASDRAGTDAADTMRSIAVLPGWTLRPLSAVNMVAPTANRSVRASMSSVLP